MNFALSKTIFLGTLSNRTILRTLLNYELLNLPVPGGRVIDLGSTKKRSSYYGFLRIRTDKDIVSCDLSDADIKTDLENNIPAEEGSFDTVLCFNLLEHIYNSNRLINEARRVLALGGSMVGFTPFLLRVHGSPHDYFRYSEPALQKMFSRAGFSAVWVKYIGRGPTLASYSQIELLFPRIVKVPAVFIAMAVDYILEKIKPQAIKGHYPLGYLFVCKK
ncbi:MAG: methyltransferase domain-containing protein [Candidatus Spechtbacterales bacterium]